MKNKVICFVMSIIFLFSVVLPIAQAAEATKEVYGWKINLKQTDKASCEISAEYYSGGSHSLMMTGADDSSSAQISTDIPVEQGKTYRICFYAKSVSASSFTCIMGSANYGLVSLLKNYNWTLFSYTYTHTGESGTVPLMFELSKKGQVYIDDVSVCASDRIAAPNLVKNPGFELTQSENMAEQSVVADIEEAFGGFADKTAMPLLHANNILIDGEGGDWKGYTGAELPLEGSGVDTISGYQGVSDLSAKLRAAYDEDYLYIYAEVTDDHHVQTADGDGYWREDSIQVVLSTVEEDYGVEIGFYLPEFGEAKYYCSELEKTEWGAVDPAVLALREQMKVQAKRTENKTVYEAAIPWNVKFEGKPESFLFNVLINDNDGSGRKGYMEWKEGIGKTKSNEEFVAVSPIPTGNQVFGYLDGAKSVYENETQSYSLYLCNTSEDEIAAQVSNSAEKISIPAKSVHRTSVNMNAAAAGTQIFEVPIYAEQTYIAKKTVLVKRNLNIAFSDFRDTKLQELKTLLQQCKEKGISTDYEEITLTTIENFIDYGLEDQNGGRESRASYVYDCLEHLYSDAKENLSAYLSGEKAPHAAKHYDGSKVTVEEQAFFVHTVDAETGADVKQPVFFSGYLDNKRESKEIADLGSNMLQFELLMSGYIGKADSVRGWSINRQGGAKGSYFYDDATAYSGDYSLRISNESALASNVYCNLVQKVSVEAGKTYQMSFYVKADGANGCYFRPNGWKTSKISLSGSYDWKKVTYEYTPTANEEIEFMFVSEDITNALYLDNIKIVEKETKKNLLQHGGFEEQPLVINGYSVNVDRFLREVIPALDEAEKNKVGVDLLMSVHYFPTTLMEEAEYSSEQNGFVKYDIFKEQPKAVVEAFFKGLVPLMADHPALQSICISNEPTYRVGRDQSNLPAWHQYLSELYHGDVAKMNTVYHESFRAFDDVPLSESYENTAIYYDYLRFNDKMFADWHHWMADMVKEIAPEIPVHAKMMSVINQTDAVGTEPTIARGTDPELFAEFSDLNGNDAWNFIGSSRTMLVKNLWYDLLTSIKNVPVFNSEDHVIEDRDERYNEKYAPHIATDLWQGALHGRSASTQWKWERSLSTTSSASGNIKHRPDAVALAGQTMLDLNRLASELVQLQNVSRDVGIFYSYPSRVHCTTHLNGVYKAYEAVSYSGKRSKIVTESMLEQGKLDQVKLLLIPNVTNTTAEAVEAVKRFMEEGGRVILIGDCFRADQYGNPLPNVQSAEYILAHAAAVSATADESGTKLISAEPLNDTVRNFLRAMNLQPIELIDTQTGLPVSDIEWSYAENGDGILLNLCLYDWDKTRNVTIRKNGAVCSNLTELRSEKALLEQFEVSGYTPMLIQIKG